MQEFNRYVELSSRYLKSIDPIDLIARITSEESRNALFSPSFNHLRSFGKSLKTIIDSGTSDEESDDESVYPSLKKTALKIPDTRSFNLFDTYQRIPHNPCFLLSPLLHIYKESKFIEMLRENNVHVQAVQIVDFNNYLGKAAVLWFTDEDQAQYFYNKFLAGDYSRLSELEGVVHVKWVDYKIYYQDFPFYAVIIRGFSKSVRLEDLNKEFPVPCKRCEMRVINGITCGLFVFNSVLDVCVMCKKVNGIKLKNGDLIKVHVHPLTQKKYSKLMIETLISDLPNLTLDEKKESFDVFQVISQGLNKSNKTSFNPLENLVRGNKNNKSSANPLENLVRGSKKQNPLESLIKKNGSK
jgi:hypothetical protein